MQSSILFCSHFFAHTVGAHRPSCPLDPLSTPPTRIRPRGSWLGLDEKKDYPAQSPSNLSFCLSPLPPWPSVREHGLGC